VASTWEAFQAKEGGDLPTKKSRPGEDGTHTEVKLSPGASRGMGTKANDNRKKSAG